MAPRRKDPLAALLRRAQPEGIWRVQEQLLRTRMSVPEDQFPGLWILRVEPAFELPARLIVEDADHASQHIHAVAASSHDAQSADVVVVAEDVMLAEPEPLASQLGQPVQQRISATDVTRHRVCPWNVPDHIGMDQRRDSFKVSGAEGICCATVGRGVRVLNVIHGENVQAVCPAEQ